MKIVNIEFKVYKYKELSPEAKKVVQQWILDDDTKCIFFKENCDDTLAYRFPNSDLTVHYSLSFCQCDGLNIEGTVKLYDVLPQLEGYSDKEIKTLEHYFKYIDSDYKFTSNSRYGYSCKFIDRKNIENDICEVIEELRYHPYKNINVDLIRKFYNDMINYFEYLDTELEKDGYKYFYEIDEEKVVNICEVNEYEFYEDGRTFSIPMCAKME